MFGRIQSWQTRHELYSDTSHNEVSECFLWLLPCHNQCPNFFFYKNRLNVNRSEKRRQTSSSWALKQAAGEKETSRCYQAKRHKEDLLAHFLSSRPPHSSFFCWMEIFHCLWFEMSPKNIFRRRGCKKPLTTTTAAKAATTTTAAASTTTTAAAAAITFVSRFCQLHLWAKCTVFILPKQHRLWDQTGYSDI